MKSYHTPDRRQLKMLIQSTNEIKTLRNRVFDCYLSPNGDKWQSITLFLAILEQCLLIVKSVFYCRLSGVYNI